MSNQIVQVSVTQTVAATPSKLQRTGALISQGSTTLAAGTYSLLTELSDLTSLLVSAQTISSLAWSASVVTVTTASAHGYPVGDTLSLTISGAAPTGYNGTFNATITSTTQFTYPLAVNPGTATTQGTVVTAGVAELTAMATTFFDQNGSIAVYVLELGIGTSTASIATLASYITNNAGFFYSYLVPRNWASDATYPAFLNNYTAANAKVYFYTTVTLSNYSSITATLKCAPMMIEASSIPATEFSMASMFWTTLNANPSSTNKVPPLCFTYVVGVTAGTWTTTQLTLFKSNNVNFINTGAEGGISNLILMWGNMPDGNPWNYWYSADWSQINLDLNISNTIINGSNTNINPLYYNQDGVNRLQTSAVNTMQNAISYGLAYGTLVQTTLDPETFATNVSNGTYTGYVVVNAVPVSTWLAANPSTYSEGIYGGLSCVYTPARGFEQIVFNLNVSELA